MLQFLKQWLIYRRDKWSMRGRDPRKEFWLFVDRKENGKWIKRIEVLSRPETVQELMVAAKIAPSKSEALRLIKAKGVEWREWYGEMRWEKIDRNQTMFSGYPFWIRTGKAMYGVPVCMLPIAGQSQRFWERLINESPVL